MSSFEQNLHKCDICNKVLSSKKTLMEHKKIHEPVQCQKCEKDFQNMILFHEHECDYYLDLAIGTVEDITTVEEFMDDKHVVGICLDDDI